MLIALLPLKSKSQRIKNKNFKNFCGKPLYKWMLDRLISNKHIHKIIINTDSKNQLNKNDNKKIIIRKRKSNLRGHNVSMNKIIEDDINFIYQNFKKKNIDFLMTHATNPLLLNTTINKAFKFYKKNINQCDSLFSVNIFKSRFYDDKLSPINHNPNKLKQTQNMKAIYEENSCFYFFSKKSFEKNEARIGKKPMSFITPLEESIDIDDNKTWKFAESIMINEIS